MNFDLNHYISSQFDKGKSADEIAKILSYALTAEEAKIKQQKDANANQIRKEFFSATINYFSYLLNYPELAECYNNNKEFERILLESFAAAESKPEVRLELKLLKAYAVQLVKLYGHPNSNSDAETKAVKGAKPTPPLDPIAEFLKSKKI